MKAGTPCLGIGMACVIGLALLLVPAHLIHAKSPTESDDPQGQTSVLPDWLELGGMFELEATRQQNVDLTRPRSDARTLLRPELQIETHVNPSDHFEGVLTLEFSREFELEDDPNEERPAVFAFGFFEAYILFKEVLGSPISLQIGRQTFEDDREWLYDDELDAVRLTLRSERLHLEAFLAQAAIVEKDFRRGRGKEDTDYYQLYGRYDFGPYLSLAAYILAQDDNITMGERLVFLGLRAQGKLAENWLYWIDAAHVRGKAGGIRARGWGVDVGALYVFDLPLAPSLVLSFAFGSGDKTPESSTDTNFRQTGLQGNASAFEGVTDIQYYGELLDPELSNLLIFTAGLGLRPISNASLMVMYHRYRQHRRSSELRDAAIDVELTGERRDIGSELDVILAWEIGHFELKLVFGAFLPGRAFPVEADTAYFAQFRLQVEF